MSSVAYTREVAAAYIDAIHAYATSLEDSEVAPQLQTSSHGRIELRRQLALQLVKQPGFKSTHAALMHCVDKEMGLGSLWRNSRATRGKHLGTLVDLCTMPESEGVFKVDDNKDINSKVIMLNMKKLAEVGTNKLEDLVERQWPSDVNMTCWTQHFVVSALVSAQLEQSTVPDAAPFTLPLAPLEAALVKKWPRGSRWEDEDVGPKPYEGRLTDCVLKDDADRYLYVSNRNGEEVVTFMPAQLAEDMHDVDHMLIKYEQGGLLARTNGGDAQTAADARAQSIIAANAAVLEQQQAAVRSGIGRNKHGVTKEEKQRSKPGNWSFQGFGEEEPAQPPPNGFSRQQSGGSAPRTSPPPGGLGPWGKPQQGHQQQQPQSDEELARALQQQLDEEGAAERRAQAGNGGGGAGGARAAPWAAAAAGGRVTTPPPPPGTGGSWPSLKASAPSNPPACPPPPGFGPAAVATASVATARAGTVPTAAATGPGPGQPSARASQQRPPPGLSMSLPGGAPAATGFAALAPHAQEPEPSSQEKVSPKSTKATARPAGVYVPPAQRAAAAAAAAATAAAENQDPLPVPLQNGHAPSAAPLPPSTSAAPPATNPAGVAAATARAGIFKAPPPGFPAPVPGSPAAQQQQQQQQQQRQPPVPPGFPVQNSSASAAAAPPPLPSHPHHQAPPPGFAPVQGPPAFPPLPQQQQQRAPPPGFSAPLGTPTTPAAVGFPPQHLQHLQQVPQPQLLQQQQQAHMHAAHMQAMQAQAQAQAQLQHMQAAQAAHLHMLQLQHQQKQQQQPPQGDGGKDAEFDCLLALLTGAEIA